MKDMDQSADTRDLAAEIAAVLPALARLVDRDAVALRLADTAACALGAEHLADSARESEEGTIARVRRYGSWGQGPCTVWADGGRGSIDDASLRNAVSARYLDYNDTYVGRAVTHPSDMIPALVALAEARSIGWDKLIGAITVGYEVMCRLADQAQLSSRGFDGSTLTPLGAAAGASWLIGLDEKRAAEALCIAALDAGMLRSVRQGKLSDWKAVASGRGAMKAVFAVRMVEAGCHSPEKVFEGKDGFCERIGGPLSISADGDPRLPRTLLKKYPVQIFIQGLIELAQQLRAELPGSSADIKSIDVGMSRQAVEMLGGPGARKGKINRETADHTPGFAIGAVLLRGRLSHADYDALLGDEKVLALMANISLHEDSEATGAYPRSFPARVTATLADGRQVVVSQPGPAAMDGASFARKLDELWPAGRARIWPWQLSGEVPHFPS